MCKILDASAFTIPLTFLTVLQGMQGFKFGSSTIQKFMSTNSYKSLGIFGNIDDPELEYFIQIANENRISFFFFGDIHVIENHDSLMLLYRPSILGFGNLLNQYGIQKCLSTNTWLVFVDENIAVLDDYFAASKLKIGLNANLFFIKLNISDEMVTQVLGTGSKNLIYQVLRFENTFSF